MEYWESILTVGSAILAMVFVLGLAYISTKWIGLKFGSTQGSRVIKIIDRVMISQDKCLLVVKAGDKTMLIGMTNNAVTNLCELPDQDIPVVEQPDFSAILQDNFKKMMGRGDK